MGSGYANCCAVCDSKDPKWVVSRQGDAVVSWGCAEHLDAVCEELQRDHEVTALIVELHTKAVEVAEINRMIRAGLGAS